MSRRSSSTHPAPPSRSITAFSAPCGPAGDRGHHHQLHRRRHRRRWGGAFAAADGIAAGGVLRVVNATVVGRVHTARLELASNSIFMARLDASGRWAHPVIWDTRTSTGACGAASCRQTQSCRADTDSDPDLAAEAAILHADKPVGSLSARQRRSIQEATESRLRPVWTTLRYGRPAYGQLAPSCPSELRTGADDESEMGVFHDVFAPQRERDLRSGCRSTCVSASRPDLPMPRERMTGGTAA